MYRIYKIPTILVLVGLLVASNTALATTTFQVQSAGSSGISGYDRVYDVFATTDNASGLAVQEMILTTFEAGSIYQDGAGGNTGPTSPPPASVEFDTYVTLPVSFSISGGAVDIGGGPGVTFDTETLDVAWNPTGGSHTGPGTFQIARFTLADWAQASYTITGFEEGSPDPPQGDTIQGTIAAPPLTLSMVQVGGAPSGYATYDFYADVNTHLGVMELRLDTYCNADIYQNSAAPDNPNEAFASYITIGPSGANEPQTTVLGGAVDLGGGSSATFDTSNIDVSWVPIGGVQTGHGQRQVARVTLDERATASWTLSGWQVGDDTPATISGNIVGPAMTLSIVEAAYDPSRPSGYTTYDLFADVNTHMGVMELIVNGANPGDIYQNATAPDNPNEAFASYVTIGPSGANEPQTTVLGGAVDLGGSSSATFDTSDIDIAWVPGEGIQTGRGLRQIARITLKNGGLTPWSLMGWQVGNDNAVSISGTISLIPGDVNGDGFVGGGDLNAVLSNWGLSGALRTQGDLTGEGDVGGADYNQVLSAWGTGTPPEPGAIPEPATLGLLLLGALVTISYRRSELS